MKRKPKIIINAPVTIYFVLLCFVVTLLGSLTGGTLTRLLFSTWHSSLASPLTYLRFFTHVLGHNGWAHLISNASYLLLLGPMLEEKYKPKTLLGIILATALITGLVNYVFFPRTALCGASGVVFAFILMTSFTGFRQGEIPLSFILVAVFYLGQQVLEGVVLRDNVSNLSHIIGGIVGSVVGYQGNRKSVYRY